jgi:hypothetical protein
MIQHFRDQFSKTLTVKKHVTIPIAKSKLEHIRIIPNRDDANKPCVFLIHEVFMVTRNFFVGLKGRSLIYKAISAMNDMIMCAESFPDDYNSEFQCRGRVQEWCINPIVNAISKSGIEILSYTFNENKLPKSTSISQQIRNDFVKLLISSFKYHKKTICKKSKPGTLPSKELRISISDGNPNIVEGAHNIIIRSSNHPDNAFIYK